MFSYLILDNQKSLSSIHKLRNHKLQQHSIPIKTVHSKHELIDLINSIDDNQYLIIDSGGFDSLYTRLAILGADINISPTADKTIELLALVTAYDSTLHQLSRKLRKNISCYVLLNRIHHSAKDFSHIDSLLSKSKHLKMLTHPLLHHKIIVVKELFMTKFYLMVWLSMNSPKINLIKDTFYSALRDIELLRTPLFLILKLPNKKKENL